MYVSIQAIKLKKIIIQSNIYNYSHSKLSKTEIPTNPKETYYDKQLNLRSDYKVG